MKPAAIEELVLFSDHMDRRTEDLRDLSHWLGKPGKDTAIKFDTETDARIQESIPQPEEKVAHGSF